MSASTLAPLPRRAASRSYAKPALWILIALAGISVLVFTEYPILAHPDDYTKRLIGDRLFLIPHALAGVIALLLGPFLFSSRFRQAHLKRHRVMGRVYVGSIAVAAPLAFYLGFSGVGPLQSFANGVMAIVWFGCTLAAFLTARNRQLAAHRQWMIRSYIFTVNFIISRVANPIPAYFHLSEPAFALNLLFLSVSYLFLSDIYFNWRELTHKRT